MSKIKENPYIPKDYKKRIEKRILPEIETKVEMIAKDCKNLISELENAKLIDNGNVLVLTDSKDGVSSYLGYENFRIFCDSLISKYLRKGKN